MLSKQDITLKIIELLPDEHHLEYDVAIKAWWASFKKDRGFRLTDAGYTAMQLLNLQTYEFAIPPDLFLKPRQLLNLDRNLSSPYYLLFRQSKSKLILFEGKQATSLIMFGNVESWLKSLGGF